MNGKKRPDEVYVSWKNHGIEKYLRAALFIYLFGKRAKEVK